MCSGLVAPQNDELEEKFDTILKSSKAENQLRSLPDTFRALGPGLASQCVAPYTWDLSSPV